MFIYDANYIYTRVSPNVPIVIYHFTTVKPLLPLILNKLRIGIEVHCNYPPPPFNLKFVKKIVSIFVHRLYIYYNSNYLCYRYKSMEKNNLT